MTAVVELRNVVKEYPGTPPVRALDDVTLVVEPGEFVGVVGPSGSGKSTLLNLIGGLDRPSAGVVSIDGNDIGRLRDKRLSAVRGRRVGFVFQSFNLLDGIDALENVALAMTYAGIPRRQRRAQAREALERVGLGSRAKHRPGQLSGGERQRVAIARALVTEPALLLADEPTGNLDTASGEVVLSLFRKLHDEGVSIVLITHDPHIADGLPRCVSMLDGRITTDEIKVA